MGRWGDGEMDKSATGSPRRRYLPTPDSRLPTPDSRLPALKLPNTNND
ncbi:hypothetical protein [Moorena producens]|nr:hypothetical protein [Moorena producens]